MSRMAELHQEQLERDEDAGYDLADAHEYEMAVKAGLISPPLPSAPRKEHHLSDIDLLVPPF